LPEGTVILAEDQFAGRGQTNNVWTSEPGKNLTFSLLLNPSFLSPEKQFFLNKSISIAINEAVSRIIGEGIKIKWPNDIYFRNQKLGGVLIENILRGTTWKHAVIGIGINVNQTEFPQNLNNPTSVKNILHSDYDITELLNHLCTAIEQQYLQLRAGKTAEINERYLSCLYRLGEQHRFLIDNQIFIGSITGVDDSGQLEVLIEGKLRKYNFKEISFVQNPGK
jgi:BirA family biotin operon repressor/biotin-[acetyl-CoA-carboxylase] ligase